MKLLILTQKVDKNDPVLGFFHGWLQELSGRFESLTVVALGVGQYELPGNVAVYSLGKENGKSVFTYLFRFYKYIWSLRNTYDAVFVHMNQEYVLLGWKSWFLLGKPIYLWRNHAQGNFLTRLAVLFSKKVFCTSPSSYTARFKKTKLMPAGIDTEFFKPDFGIYREPHSVLFLGRISPVKRVQEFVDWFKTLGSEYTATVAGEAPPKYEGYFERVKASADGRVTFIGAVDQEAARTLYQSHELYVNKTPAGSFDKAILEAAACGNKVFLDNADLKFLEEMSEPELRRYVVENHSLKLLAQKLSSEIQ